MAYNNNDERAVTVGFLKERFNNGRGRVFNELSNRMSCMKTHRSHRRRDIGTSCYLQYLTWNVWPPMFHLLFDSMTPCIAIQLLDRSWRLRLSRSWSTWSCRNCVSAAAVLRRGVNPLLELHDLAEVGGNCDARVMEVQRGLIFKMLKCIWAHCQLGLMKTLSCHGKSGTTGCWLAMLAGGP